MNGIEREVDKLGRIVIPKDYRAQLGLTCGSRVLISLEDGALRMVNSASKCAICGDFAASKKIRLCESCIRLAISCEKELG